MSALGEREEGGVKYESECGMKKSCELGDGKERQGGGRERVSEAL